ncbi:MAG: adenylate kinase [Chlamydiales bacterium]|nr:adenylate kinase [Chlamydiia bacterium]MCP5508150.1 adenylate kinase [Chlamydiales bacterium]
MQKIVIFLGPPGSGKGTQAKRLAAELNVPHISTGDLFRDNLSRKTELGERVRSYMESGNLVPDEIVNDMLFDRVSREDCNNGYLLDGFPRSIVQAEAFSKKMTRNNEVIVLNLQVPDAEIVKRLEGRRSCSKCGAIYHIDYSPPKEEGICDHCGGALQQRSDDRADVIKERLNVYHKETAPLEKYYHDLGLLQNIEGTRDPKTVYHDIKSRV